MAGLDSLVNVLKAAGEVTRLRLLALLAAGELSVKDLTEILDQSQPRVSRHLKLLAEAGLIVRHAEGAWAYFGLSDDSERALLARHLVDLLDRDDPQVADDMLRLQRVREGQREQAAAYFAEVAGSWDALRNLHVPEAAVEAAILEAVGGRKLDLLLDLGTGTGRMLELLAEKYQRGVGVDSSREMIAVARAKLVAANISHAHIRLGDITEIDAHAGPADLIIIHQVLHYFDDPGNILHTARRALKPGGEMIIVDFAPHELEFLRTENAHRRLGLSQVQMETWARSAGLDVTGFRDFPNKSGRENLTVCLWTLKNTGDVGRRSNSE